MDSIVTSLKIKVLGGTGDDADVLVVTCCDVIH